jgi:zinc protease
MFGADHPYGSSFTGSGTAESISDITLLDLKNFHATWFKPGSATLLVVGDTTLTEIVELLEGTLGDWESGLAPRKEIPQVAELEGSHVYLVDRPGAPQSYIYAAHVAPAFEPDTEWAIDAVNTVFGGSFTSRINMNLREDKHWSYGARSQIRPLQNQRAFIVSAGVQTDKSKESLVEVREELTGILEGNLVTAEELEKIKQNKVQRLAGRWETLDAVKRELRQMVAFGLSDDYYDTYSENLESLTLSEVRDAAGDLIKPDRLIWLVVGDLEKIESGISELSLGTKHVVDADGNPVN